MSITFTTLRGNDPQGFLAAVGLLGVLRRRSGSTPRLGWTDDVVPMARLEGVADRADAVDAVVADLDRWRESPVLQWPVGHPIDDAKLRPDELRAWTEHVNDVGDPDDEALLAAVVAEGAVDGKGNSKPTHLHFTAGQQKFLHMVRELRDSMSRDGVEEALVGPWQRTSTLPVLGWEAGTERLYAHRAVDPTSSSEKRRGVPGADWLAFLGLAVLPTMNRRGHLRTTGCKDPWKLGGAWCWPLWTQPVPWEVVGSLVSDPRLPTMNAAEQQLRGISRVCEAPIRRTDQGGYGSFGAAGVPGV